MTCWADKIKGWSIYYGWRNIYFGNFGIFPVNYFRYTMWSIRKKMDWSIYNCVYFFARYLSVDELRRIQEVPNRIYPVVFVDVNYFIHAVCANFSLKMGCIED